MFKCKQCGHTFSANIPDRCPECGAINRQPDSAGSRNFWAMILVGGLAELLIIAILVGIVVALAVKYL
ncbi:MAG: rubredoxin-like domain-containing protein [Planctomycetota bacterium]